MRPEQFSIKKIHICICGHKTLYFAWNAFLSNFYSKQDLSRKCSASKDFRLSFQFLPLQKLFVKKFESRKNLVEKNFVRKTILNQKEFWDQKIFLLQKFLVWKNLFVRKKFLVQKILVRTFFNPPKNFCFKKILKKILVKKIFWSKIFFIQRKF